LGASEEKGKEFRANAPQSIMSKKIATRPRFQVGVHLSIAGGHHKALDLGRDLGCEVVQIFTKNNMQWMAPPLASKAIDAYLQAREGSAFASIFGHSGYLINLAATDPSNLEKSRQSLLLELVRCSQLELPFIVLHPGAHLGAGEQAGLDLIAESLEWIFARYPGGTRIALETTAGQGSCVGNRIEHLAYLFAKVKEPERLAVCLDTCHLFAAGYDIRTPAGIDAFIAGFRRHLSWENVVCVHMNDSKGGLASRIDRHELLGDGKIGWTCFETILHHPAFAEIPLCIETPKGKDNANDREMLRKMKEARERPASPCRAVNSDDVQLSS
jgi:deoxyribonuclease IV